MGFRLITLTGSLLLWGCAGHQVQDLYEGDASQGALVTSSPTVLVQYVDNDEVTTGFVGQTKIFEVGPGQHTFLVEYSDLFDIDSDDHEKVASRPAKITFTVESGQSYQLKNSPQATLLSAKEFAEAPEFWVENTETLEKVSSSVELSRPRSFAAAVKSMATPVYEFDSDKVSDSSVSLQAVTHQGKVGLDQIKQTWSQASKADQAAFLMWLESQ